MSIESAGNDETEDLAIVAKNTRGASHSPSSPPQVLSTPEDPFKNTSRPKTAEALAKSKNWFPKLTNPKKRLAAAKAYRSHPDQSNSMTGKIKRYTAALIALGYSDSKAELFAIQYIQSRAKK